MSNEDPIVVLCTECREHLVGIPHGSYERHHGYHIFSRCVLLSCPKCEAPLLVYQDDEHGYDSVSPKRIWSKPEVLYPVSVNFVDSSVPEGISASYLEAVNNFNNGHFTSAAFMCRRALEGICVDRGARGRFLHNKLEDLKKKGTIEPRLHTWASQVLKDLGNDAAHDVGQTISKDDAQDALEFTKAIIEYLYVFEAAFQRFEERRGGATT